MQKPHNVARCHRSAAISCCKKSSQVPKSKRFGAAQSCLTFFEHDLFGKPLHAFPDHALAKSRPVKVRWYRDPAAQSVNAKVRGPVNLQSVASRALRYSVPLGRFPQAFTAETVFAFDRHRQARGFLGAPACTAWTAGEYRSAGGTSEAARGRAFCRICHVAAKNFAVFFMSGSSRTTV